MTKDEMKEILGEVLEEQRKQFWVPAEQHYLHHKHMENCLESKAEWEKNHEFVAGVRQSGQLAKGAMIKLLATAIFGALATAFWHIFKG